MIDHAISKLITYAVRTGLIDDCERIWATNTALDVLKLDSYTDPGQDWGEIDLSAVLDELLDDAHARGVLTENSVVYRDLFDTQLMGCLTPRPAQVIRTFKTPREDSPRQATDWYYQFSQNTNYIRRDRIAKDVQWKTDTEYGELDITINLSKPEKDPKAIAAAGAAEPLLRLALTRLASSSRTSYRSPLVLTKGSFISSLVLSKSHPLSLGCDLGPLRRSITPPTSGRLRPDKSALGLCPSAPESTRKGHAISVRRQSRQRLCCIDLLPGAQTHKSQFICLFSSDLIKYFQPTKTGELFSPSIVKPLDQPKRSFFL